MVDGVPTTVSSTLTPFSQAAEASARVEGDHALGKVTTQGTIDDAVLEGLVGAYATGRVHRLRQ